MNLKQLALLGLAFTTLTTTTEAAQKKKSSKPAATLTTNKKAEIKIPEEVISRVFEAWYPVAQKAEGTFGFAYKDSTGHVTCGTGMSEASPIFKHAVFLDAKTHKPITASRRAAYLAKVRGTKGYASARKLANREGIYMSDAEAKRLAYMEIKTVLDEVYSFAQKRKGIDLSKHPIEVQVLVADLVYQVGYPKFERGWTGLWACLKNKDYKNLPNHVQVKDGNKDRRTIRDALARIAYAKQQGTDYTPLINKLKKVGVKNTQHFVTQNTIDEFNQMAYVNPNAMDISNTTVNPKKSGTLLRFFKRGQRV